MFKAKKIIFLYTDTSVHPGAGDSAGIVDLPIQREVHTELPVIQGSELKGALREYFETHLNENDIRIKQVFGAPEAGDDKGSGGAIGLTMARILLFPIASIKGVFAWVTCPMCLDALKRDLMAISTDKIKNTGLDRIPFVSDPKKAQIPESANDLLVSDNIFLSEFPFKSQANKDLNAIAKWLSERLPSNYNYFKTKLFQQNKNRVQSNLVLIHDNMFRELLKIRTEVVHRNQIDKKTGTSDGLWTEENLPGDTVMYSMIYAADPYKSSDDIQTADDVAGFFEQQQLTSLILGGNQTVGRGWMSTTYF
jgi:CRISPR-associated protein Cmr4